MSNELRTYLAVGQTGKPNPIEMPRKFRIYQLLLMKVDVVAFSFEGDLAAFEERATEVAGILRALANERRLMILCKLVEFGEANVTALAGAVGLSQSALSQHLAKMRAEGIVSHRRDRQTMWYRVADPRTEELFALLHRLYCGAPR